MPSKDIVLGASTGTAGVTYPWWSDFVSAATGANQLLVGALGVAVLILTLRKLWLEGKKASLEREIASRRLREMDKGQ